eukprot:7080059-Lingulodinium_polyedra.AAC.1
MRVDEKSMHAGKIDGHINANIYGKKTGQRKHRNLCGHFSCGRIGAQTGRGGPQNGKERWTPKRQGQ